MLKNAEGLLKTSDDSWNFKTKDDWIYIENISKGKVLGTTNDSKIILEVFKEDNAGQLWKKGMQNDYGFFTLENFEVPKLITGISDSVLEIKGNITLRQIPT